MVIRYGAFILLKGSAVLDKAGLDSDDLQEILECHAKVGNGKNTALCPTIMEVDGRLPKFSLCQKWATQRCGFLPARTTPRHSRETISPRSLPDKRSPSGRFGFRPPPSAQLAAFGGVQR